MVQKPPARKLSPRQKTTPRTPAGSQSAPRASSLALNPIQHVQQLLLDQFMPASVLVNNDHDILYYFGTLNPYLAQPRGAPTHHLLSRARDGLGAALRTALEKMATCPAPRLEQQVLVKRGKRFAPAKFTIQPIAQPENGRPLYLIVFEDLPPLPEQVQEQFLSDPLIHQLELELRATREDLHAAILDVESSNAALKNTNEELNAAVEELRSSNEELESSHEELQALNDELQAINQQLQEKVDALENANDDLINLVASSDIATLCLDRRLHIKWLTPGMQSIFNLLDTDIGRPIQDFSANLTGNDLIKDAKRVLKSAAPSSKEIKGANGQWYQRRILPFLTQDRRVTGVTITFADITEAKLAAASLEQRVMERTSDLRALTVALSLTEERERRALAVDLHDDLGQVLAAAKIKLATLTRLEPHELIPRCQEISALLDQAHNTIRSMTFQLSPPVLHELGLVPALEWLAEEMQRQYDLHVKVTCDEIPPKLDSALNTLLFRSVRELLINVAKHAKVNSARVNIDLKKQELAITVMDAGIGLHKSTITPQEPPQTNKSGFGLFSIRERLHHIGGTMQIESTPDEGTTVTLTAPLTLSHRKRKPRKV